MKETKMKVPDMSCGHCVAAVRGSLEVLEGVEDIDVSLETHTVIVISIEDLQANDLLEAVGGAGYTPELAH